MSPARALDYLVVRFAGREHALPAEAVRGIVELRSVARRILRTGPGGARTALVDGRTLPVIPVHHLIGLRERPFAARTCLVLIAQPASLPSPNCALIADSVSRVERIDGSRRREQPDSRWIQARVRLGEKWRAVLDLKRLAEAQGLRAA